MFIHCISRLYPWPLWDSVAPAVIYSSSQDWDTDWRVEGLWILLKGKDPVMDKNTIMNVKLINIKLQITWKSKADKTHQWDWTMDSFWSINCIISSFMNCINQKRRRRRRRKLSNYRNKKKKSNSKSNHYYLQTLLQPHQDQLQLMSVPVTKNETSSC